MSTFEVSSGATTVAVRNTSTTSGQRVQFVVGNTYKRIPDSLAKRSRSGNTLKIHDWKLYVDVVTGSPSTIEKVTFDLGASFRPQSFTCQSPVPIKQNDGSLHWRFYTRQQSYGSLEASATIFFIGGSRKTVRHMIACRDRGARSGIQAFVERQPPKILPPVKIPREQHYGIELELTSMKEKAAVWQVISQSLGGESAGGWRLVHDSSIACNLSQPNCNTFELVSPILEGEEGLKKVSRVLNALRSNNVDIKVNKSMGFHVHVEVSTLSQHQLNKICQNFVKYEDVFDSFVPPSRRTGSQQSDRYFQSNRKAVGYTSNRLRHEALAECQDIVSLGRMMNPSGRYYKLNLQNLVTRRQPTVEFRQHSATTDSDKICNWIRLCVNFVRNSARLTAPKCFREGRDLDHVTHCLFHYVVKDRALLEFYRKRQREMQQTEQEPCCDSCRHGGQCVAVRNRNK